MGDKIQFASRLAKSRWVVVVAAIWIQCFSGSSYSFAIYSQTLKSTFGYDQKSLDTVAASKDLGANVGLVSGLIFDSFSPWVVLGIGAVQSGLAYMMLWLSLTGRVAFPGFWQTCVYMFLAANGQTFFNTGCVVTCVQNFTRSRGTVIGLMKGYLGLSGAILTQIYHGVYGDEPTSFLFMVAWLPSLTAFLLMFTVRLVPSPPDGSHESTNLYILSTIAVSLAAYLMGVIVLENTISFSHGAYVAVCLVTIVILLLPMGVVVKSVVEEGDPSHLSREQSREPLVINGEDLSFDPPSYSVPTNRDVECSKSCSQTGTERERTQFRIRPPIRGEDHTVLEAIMSADFWLLVVAMACGMGSGLSANDNTAQIGASLGYAPEKVGTFICLFSIWNFMGRIGFGTLSELFMHRYKTARPVFLALSQGLMSFGHLLISSAIPGSLYPGLLVVGLCYGAQWSLMPAITSELFGLRRFATLFNVISTASPAGAYVLSVQVAGRLYDIEAKKEHHLNELGLFRRLSSAGLECHGAHCFRLSFIIMAAVSLCGCTVCALLVVRTRSFYSRMLCSSPS